MVCYEGKVSFWSFFLASCLVVVLFAPNVKHEFLHKFVTWGFLLHFILVNVVLKVLYHHYVYQISIRAAFLGFMFILGVFIWYFGPLPIRPFGIYMAVMCFFHFTEYLAIAIANPKVLSLDTYMLTHSPEYLIAAVSSWIEFCIECYFWPEMKSFRWISYLGLIICCIGEIIRKTAILWAGTNFNHLVQSRRTEGHVLVTSGIYKYCRHPSYVGWFYWAVGTQIILINPLCITSYLITSWMFFRERILIEEVTLLNFFGQQYFEYQKKVPTGLPFIYGYKINL